MSRCCGQLYVNNRQCYNYLRCLISGGCATFVYPEESSYGKLPGPVFCVPPDHTPTIWSAADYEAQQRFDRVWTRQQSLVYNGSNTSDQK